MLLLSRSETDFATFILSIYNEIKIVNCGFRRMEIGNSIISLFRHRFRAFKFLLFFLWHQAIDEQKLFTNFY